MLIRILMRSAILGAVFAAFPSFGLSAFHSCSGEYTAYTTAYAAYSQGITNNIESAEGTWLTACTADEVCQASVKSVGSSLGTGRTQAGYATYELTTTQTDFQEILSSAQAAGIGGPNVPLSVAKSIFTNAVNLIARIESNYYPAFQSYLTSSVTALNAAQATASNIPELIPLKAADSIGNTIGLAGPVRTNGRFFAGCALLTLNDIAAMTGIKIQGAPPQGPPPAGGGGGPAPQTSNPPATGSVLFFSNLVQFSMPNIFVDFVNQFASQLTVLAAKDWEAYRGISVTTSVLGGAYVGPITDFLGNTVVPANTPICLGLSPVGPVGGASVDPFQFSNYSTDYGCYQLLLGHLSLTLTFGTGMLSCAAAGTNINALMTGTSTSCALTYRTDGPPGGPVRQVTFTYFPATTNDLSAQQQVTLSLPTDNPPAGSCYSWGGTGWYYNTSISGCTGTGGTGSGTGTP